MDGAYKTGQGDEVALKAILFLCHRVLRVMLTAPVSSFMDNRKAAISHRPESRVSSQQLGDRVIK